MNILILSPHTDDAELGCGGSIIKFLEMGHTINWVVFSTAEESLPKGMRKDTLKREYWNVVDKIGFPKNRCKIFDFRVRHLPEKRQEILDELIALRKDLTPDLVIGPSINDMHQDHQVVAHEMLRAFKISSGIACYELPWNHIKFDVQLFVKLEKSHIMKKSEMLQCYKSQMDIQRPYFSEEFIYGLAKTRGVQCSADYAESFEVLRWMM